MSKARAELLSDLVDEIAARGMADRSLRELASAAGTSHRMVLYHFGSRAGLVAAVTAEVDRRERAFMLDLAETARDPGHLVRLLWAEVSSPERRAYVRLFFEALASASRAPAADDPVTEPWLDAGSDAAERMGSVVDVIDMRLAVAVIRGLLIDVLATGDVAAATESLERFLAGWSAAGSTAPQAT